MRRPVRRGFTLVEFMVVVAIVGVTAALAYDGLRRARPRATFDGVAAELQSLVHQARQQALMAGVPVAVLVFPNFPQPSTGRIVVVQDDPAQSILSASSALRLDTYNPAVLAAPPNGQVVTTLDLPAGVQVGPATGLGRALPFPYNGIATTVACSFCTGANGRGAIVFDSRGRTTFYAVAGTVLTGANGGPLSGGSLSLFSTDLASGVGTTFTTSTLVITAPFGSMRTHHNG